MTTETTKTITTDNGAAITITGKISSYNGSAYTTIKIERNGKVLIDDDDYIVLPKIQPSTRTQVEAAIYLVRLAVRSTTVEAEAARIATLESYEASYTATQKAMSI